MAWTLEIKSKAVKFIKAQKSETQHKLKQALNTLIDHLNCGILL